MNVLINCLSSDSGGAISYLRNLLPKLEKLFQDSTHNNSAMILAHQEQKHLFPTIPESHCILLKNSRPKSYRRFLWEYCNLGKIIREHNIDVLFTLCQISPHVKGLKQVLMLRSMDPFCFRNYKYSFKPWLRANLLFFQSRQSLCNADRVIAVSGYVEQVLRDRLNISEDRICRIYHGRDENFTPDSSMKNDDASLAQMGIDGPYILTCGSLWPYRRCEDVIKAFDLYKEKNGENVNLVIAGAKEYGPYTKIIENLIAASPNSDRIHTVGHVSYEAMQSLYRRCVFCVFATEVEACPNIAIEALSSGCAVISSDSPPLPEIFAGSSVEFASRNVEELALKMQNLTGDEQYLKDMKNKALERSHYFSWDKCAKQTYQALVQW